MPVSRIALILNYVEGAACPAVGGERRRNSGDGQGLQAALDQAEALRELRGLDERRLRDIGVRRDWVATMLGDVGGVACLRFALAAFTRWLGTADWVMLTTAGLFLALALLLPEQFLASLRFTFGSLWFAAPFLLLAAMVAAGVSLRGRESKAADRAFWRNAAQLPAFPRHALAIGALLLKWLTLVFLVESLLLAAVAGGLVTPWLGSSYQTLLLLL